MYGMVNLAIQEFLCDRYGHDRWTAIRATIPKETDRFLTMEQYPDQLSFDIMTAASDLIAKPISQLLEELGEYWIAFAQRSGYGDLMDVLGEDLFEALQNLDNLHTRVGFAFPDLRPPSFWLTDIEDDTLILHYQSVRSGLAPMVIGLVRGLARRFNQNVSVRQIEPTGRDHSLFIVAIVQSDKDC
jgi:Haem-NO-binding